MQFHWPSLALGILGILLIIAGVNGSYRTVWPAIAHSFHIPLSEPGAPRQPPGNTGGGEEPGLPRQPPGSSGGNPGGVR